MFFTLSCDRKEPDSVWSYRPEKSTILKACFESFFRCASHEDGKSFEGLAAAGVWVLLEKYKVSWQLALDMKPYLGLGERRKQNLRISPEDGWGKAVNIQSKKESWTKKRREFFAWIKSWADTNFSCIALPSDAVCKVSTFARASKWRNSCATETDRKKIPKPRETWPVEFDFTVHGETKLPRLFGSLG